MSRLSLIAKTGVASLFIMAAASLMGSLAFSIVYTTDMDLLFGFWLVMLYQGIGMAVVMRMACSDLPDLNVPLNTVAFEHILRFGWHLLYLALTWPIQVIIRYVKRKYLFPET